LRELSSQGGRTVLFVSHNPSALASLCQRGIVLDQGRLVFDGDIQSALGSYLGQTTAGDSTEWTGEAGDNTLRLRRVCVRASGPTGQFDCGQPLEIEAEADVLAPVEGVILGWRLLSESGQVLAYSLYDDGQSSLPEVTPPGRLAQTWRVPGNSLAPGRYRLSFILGVAWKKVSYEQMDGEIGFELHNISGIGSRYALQGDPRYNSVCHPDWCHETRFVPQAVELSTSANPGPVLLPAVTPHD
jgi:lipopolysaccharide transport system ATP-binding protein